MEQHHARRGGGDPRQEGAPAAPQPLHRRPQVQAHQQVGVGERAADQQLVEEAGHVRVGRREAVDHAGRADLDPMQGVGDRIDPAPLSGQRAHQVQRPQQPGAGVQPEHRQRGGPDRGLAPPPQAGRHHRGERHGGETGDDIERDHEAERSVAAQRDQEGDEQVVEPDVAHGDRREPRVLRRQPAVDDAHRDRGVGPGVAADRDVGIEERRQRQYHGEADRGHPYHGGRGGVVVGIARRARPRQHPRRGRGPGQRAGGVGQGDPERHQGHRGDGREQRAGRDPDGEAREETRAGPRQLRGRQPRQDAEQDEGAEIAAGAGQEVGAEAQRRGGHQPPQQRGEAQRHAVGLPVDRSRDRILLVFEGNGDGASTRRSGQPVCRVAKKSSTARAAATAAGGSARGRRRLPRRAA